MKEFKLVEEKMACMRLEDWEGASFHEHHRPWRRNGIEERRIERNVDLFIKFTRVTS